MDTQFDFLINNPDKIISKLSILLKNKNLLTVGMGDYAHTFVTTILALDKKNNVFICDGCDEEVLDYALKSNKNLFKTEHLGAMIGFDTGKFAKTDYQGKPAFSATIPALMRWLEQREFYRVRLPSTTASQCQFPLNGEECVNLKLYDISIRGFSMLNSSDEISELLITGARFEKAKLIIENKEEISISFEIRSKFIMNPNNFNKMEKIGCKFTRITPWFENAVHGYMLELERELLKKRAETTSYLKL